MKLFIRFFVIMCILAGSRALGAVIHVPGDQPYIQSAVNVAANGDTVLIADGLYFELGNTDVNLLGKQLIIQSENDNPDLCIINCNDAGRAFFLNNGEPEGTIIRGLTIMNGDVMEDPFSQHGGGIYVGSECSLSVENCKIMYCNALLGGSIYVGASASCSIEDSTMNENDAVNGGAVYADDGSTLTLADCVCNTNTAVFGGAVAIQNFQDFTLTNTTLESNAADDIGGAVYCTHSSGTAASISIQGGAMTGNSATQDGSAFYSSTVFGYESFEFNADVQNNTGGVYAISLFTENASPLSTDYLFNPSGTMSISANSGGGLRADGCHSVSIIPVDSSSSISFVGNDRDGDGGSVFLHDCPGGFTALGSSLFYYTYVTGDGGAIFAFNTPLYLYNAMIRDNHADVNNPNSDGGGVICDGGTFINCAFTMNQAGGFGGGIISYGDCTFMNCTIVYNEAFDCGGIKLEEGATGILTNCIAWHNTIDASSEHLNIGGAATASYSDFENGQGPSICDNCITDDPVISNPVLPFISGSPCMDAGTNAGAPPDDIQRNPRPSGFKVDMGVNEVQYQTQCSVAFTGISTTGEADMFSSGCGFTPEADLYTQLDTTYLEIGEPIEVYLTSETNTDFTVHLLDDMDPATGCLDYGTTYARTVYAGGPVYIVVDGGEGTFDLEVRCNFPPDITIGSQKFSTIQAAIDHSQTGDTIALADGSYTGICNRNIDFDGHSVTLMSAGGDPESCIIDLEGAGHGLVLNSGETGVVIDGISIVNGSDTTTGAGLLCSSTSPLVTHCIIRDNTSLTGFGGGVYLASSAAVFENCVITGNAASSGFGGTGGGIYCGNASSPSFINCTIMGNTAGNVGGGMTIHAGSGYVIQNCIFWGNSADIGENEIQADIPVTIEFCNIQGPCPPNVTCVDSISDDPGIVLPDYHLPSDSPCIDNGTDTGAPVTDIDGEPRPNPFWGTGITDIGADEFYDVCVRHGDVNFSGTITAEDAQIAFNIVLGSVTPTYDQWCAADCNGSNSITAADAQNIFYSVLGLGDCVDPL